MPKRYLVIKGNSEASLEANVNTVLGSGFSLSTQCTWELQGGVCVAPTLNPGGFYQAVIGTPINEKEKETTS